MSDLLIERALMGNPLEGGVSNRMLMFLMSRYGYQHHSPERGPRFAGREGPGEKRTTSEAARAWRKVQAEAYSLRADRVMDAIEEALEAGDEAELEAAIRCPGGISDAFMLMPCPPAAPEECAQEKVPENLHANAQAKRQPDALTRFLTSEDAPEESANAPESEQGKEGVHAPTAPASGEMNKDTNTRITMGPVRGLMPEPEPAQETIRDAPPTLGPTHPHKQHRSEERPP